MKDINLLVWLTQLGLGVALPLAGSVFLGVWLRTRFSLGIWVVLCCLALGLCLAAGSFRSSLKAMESMSKSDKDDPPPPASFGDHD